MFAVSEAPSKWHVEAFDEVLFFRALGSHGLIFALILPRTG
jgi:hypothetical protein